jgi:PIN domain nuclease of toxin-antitoxin system
MTSRGYLLDTHILLWLEHNPERLGKTAKRLIERRSIYYSAISVAELALKYSLRGLTLTAKVPEGWQALGIRALTFDDEAAIASGNLSKEWLPDPADRQLVATAEANGLSFITADQKILKLKYEWIVDATI